MSLEKRVVGLIEDDVIMGESLVQRLALEGVTVKWWQRGGDAVASLAEYPLEAVVCDIRLPDLDGEALFRRSGQAAGAPPFLFITGHADIDQAVRLMRSGAADYVTKPFEMDDFLLRLGELLKPRDPVGSPVLGISPPMRAVEGLLIRLARVRSTVLITGETGTGKDVAARFLHSAAHAERPFMAVNCGAIPADLMESELFGHERGAFTGAMQRHHGYAERAGDGTLFLDEIAELRPELQVKLLRLLEERTFHRVGGERPLPFSGRLIAATNADLGSLVASGRFREDLFYRINVVGVRMPPLRERSDDVPWLMERFFGEFSGQVETTLRGISAQAEEAARSYAWPGNVRELRNRMERAVALGLGPWLSAADLFPEAGAAPPAGGDARLGSLEDARQEAERRHILRALEATRGEVGAAARLLGVGRTTLWEKMRRLGVAADPGPR